MDKINNIKKIFKHKADHSNHSFVIMRPNHDWKVIVYLFISSMIVFLAFSFYFLDRVKKDDLFKVTRNTDQKPVVVNQTLLDQTINEFNTKAKKIINFPTKEYLIIDPNK